MKSRILWIDSWRGLLILLVVLGHIFGGASHLCSSSINHAFDLLRKAIYLFHMPAFFVLAGLLWRKPSMGFLHYSGNKVRSRVIPYFTFAFLSWLVFAAFSGSFANSVKSSTDAYYSSAHNANLPFWTQLAAILHAGGWPNDVGLKINSVLWFLPCLFIIEIIWYWLDGFCSCVQRTTIVAAMLFVGDWLIPSTLGVNVPWGGRGRIAEFLLFFLIGNRVVPSLLRFISVFRQPCLKVATSILALAVIIALARYTPNMYRKNTSFLWCFVFAVIAVVGTMASLFVARQFDCALLQRMGLASMTIMLVHKWPLMAFQLKIQHIRLLFGDSPAHAVLGSVIVFIGTMLASLLMHEILRHHAKWAIGMRSNFMTDGKKRI